MADEQVILLKQHSTGTKARQFLLLALPLTAISAAYFLLEMHLPMNHDVAWLLDAGSRWNAGARLYHDVIEVNPPLVFYVYRLLTLGFWTKASFIAGTVAAMLLAAIWSARLAGPRWGIATLVIVISAGITDFGQRDHLAAIVAIPYLFAFRAGRNERVLIGAWSFLGFALKPHLMLIPVLATIGSMLANRSWKPAISPENIALASLSVAYAVAAWLVHPEFFTDMLPLARLVYFAYGSSIAGFPPAVAIVALGVFSALFGLQRRELWPVSGAVVGALLSYFLQGRFWSYHLLPALALTLFLLLLMAPRAPVRFGICLTLIGVMAEWLLLTERRSYTNFVPTGAEVVLFLSPHVGSAYPAVIDSNVVHASHYPAMWTLPGAWSLLHNPAATSDQRDGALKVLNDTRRIIVDDIVRYCPNPIFVDDRPRKPYFGSPFDFVAFLKSDHRFKNYLPREKRGMFRVYWRERPCPGKKVAR